MKKILLLLPLLLIGCQTAPNGWTEQAPYLLRHYDAERGVACYLDRHTRIYALSCVKAEE